MNAAAQAVLTSIDGKQVPLKAVSARGRLDGLLFELGIEQRYHNDSAGPIEAVFTFPLPLQAQLLGFDLVLGDRHLKAVAAPRGDASARYEKAIDQGNAAVLLEHDGNGLYTANLGNLMPGETAIIQYRYAQLLESHQGHVRIQVPTVIAPRYGNPADAGLAGPAVPGTNALREYPFSITVELPGVTDPATLSSPTHALQVTPAGNGLSVALLRTGFLDRDFVLEVAATALPQGALLSRDGDGWVLLASAALAVDERESRSLTLKVLLDCSGSMQGTSIVAAQRALLSILGTLNGDDQIALTRFGTQVEPVTQGLEPADRATLDPLKAVVRRIKADLGGTEMARAIDAVVKMPVPRGRQADILLITDGEIHAIQEVVDLAARAGHRLFTIAIGAAPVEALARALAQKTGGGCEFVAPGEDAEGAILRTVKRLRAAPRTLAAVSWPGTPEWVAPLPEAVFPGDTLHLMAGFKERPSAGISVAVRDVNGRTQMITQALGADVEGDRIPRLAASRRLTQLPEGEARALAVTYQLVSPYTSLIVVAERQAHERAQQLPAVVPVAHMMVESALPSADYGGAAYSLSSPFDAAPLSQAATGRSPFDEIDPEEFRPQPPAPEDSDLVRLEAEELAFEFDWEVAAIFGEGAVDLLAASQEALMGWRSEPDNAGYRIALERPLYTLKGGARMAGLEAMGDLCDLLERLLRLVASGGLTADTHVFEILQAGLDELGRMCEHITDIDAHSAPSTRSLLLRIRSLSPALQPPSQPPAPHVSNGEALLTTVSAWLAARKALPRGLDELAACGVDKNGISEIRLAGNRSGEPEETVVGAFLALLADSVLGPDPALADALGAVELREALRDHVVMRERRYRTLRSQLSVIVARMR